MQSVVTKEEGKNSDWVLVGMEIAPLTGSWCESNCLILLIYCVEMHVIHKLFL